MFSVPMTYDSCQLIAGPYSLSMTCSQSTLKYTVGDTGFMSAMDPTFHNSYYTNREREFAKLTWESS